MQIMTRRFLFAAGAFVLGLAVAPEVQAQPLAGPTCTVGGSCGHTLNATVPTLVRLTLENATTALGTLTETEFDNGQTIAGPRFEARANRAYNVTLASASGTWGGTGNPAKLAGDVGYAVVTSAAGCGTAGAYTALSTTAANIFSGTAGLSVRQQLCFDITWNYASDAPGTYDLPLNLTVTAP
jgi:hypothetical protein